MILIEGGLEIPVITAFVGLREQGHLSEIHK
jgi:hypothetical protein